MAQRSWLTRREFLARSTRAALALPLARLPGAVRPCPDLGFPNPSRGLRGDSSVGAALRAGQRFPLTPYQPFRPSPPTEGRDPPAGGLHRFTDLRRHFIFEYYPWYGADPYEHWEQWDRVPPFDLASNYVPRLGAYDSRSRAVLEQHARWIADTGAGAINVSWWGPGSDIDRSVPLLMDVMRDHDIKVTFHLEPWTDDHGLRFGADVRYLLREYGERRHWDALLLLRDARGVEGPVFKGFRTIVPAEGTDCHGVTQPVPDYTSDADWQQVLDPLRDALRADFDRVTLLADSLDLVRARNAGFDGIAVYDNFIRPETYLPYAAEASRLGLVFSFNVNPGYDSIEPRQIDSDCYSPTPFAPPAVPPIDWSSPAERERAAGLSRERIRQAFASTIEAQTDPLLLNDRRGFFLVYLTSFNEWHEGHQFEPMKDAGTLLLQERVFGYHNPQQGDYRLLELRRLLQGVLAPVESLRLARA